MLLVILLFLAVLRTLLANWEPVFLQVCCDSSFISTITHSNTAHRYLSGPSWSLMKLISVTQTVIKGRNQQTCPNFLLKC